MSHPTFDEYRASVEVTPEEAARTGKNAIRLTDEQVEVIRSESPAILVVAGAGSGKTATMAQRIAWHVASGNVAPDQVLGLTFTRKAAGELSERVNKQLAKLERFVDSDVEPARKDADERADRAHAETRRPTVSTYNSFASEIASSYAMLIGEDPRARLVQDAERWQIMRSFVDELSAEDADAFDGSKPPSITENAISLASAIIDNGLTTDEVRVFLHEEHEAVAHLFAKSFRISAHEHGEYSKDGREGLKGSPPSLRYRIALLDLVDRYFEYKKENSVIEFADQVAWATRILREVPAVGESLRDKYKLILLDEYQDTSINQANFLHLAFGDADSVCAVGDPNQAIYSWRGASANALGDFAKAFRIPVEDRLTLSSAFRNDQRILDAANALTESFDYGALNVKKLEPREQAGEGRVEVVHAHLKDDSNRRLVERIGEEMTKSFEQTGKQAEVAILCKKRKYIDELVPLLSEAGIPFEAIGGEAIIEKPEVKLLRAALGLVANPQKNSLVVHMLNFFAVGASDIRALAQAMREVADRSVAGLDGVDAREERNFSEALEWLRAHPEDSKGFSEEGHRRVLRIARILADLRQYRQLEVSQIIERAIELLDLRAYASARTQGGTRVKNALAGFVRLGHQYSADNPLADLAGFLELVDLMEEKEHGGEGESGEDAPILPTEEIEPEAGVVQLMTVHAAKGLEWDIVAVPELVYQQFDAEQRSVEQWNKSKKLLPYPLRQDREHLPRFATKELVNTDFDVDKEDFIDILDRYGKYAKVDVPKHRADEERRLAYVAFTRPRHTLLLGSYDFATEKKAVDKYLAVVDDPDPDKLPDPNSFLVDIRDHVVLSGNERRFWDCAELVEWAESENLTSEAAIEAAKEDEEPVVWPADVDRSLDRRIADESGALAGADDAELVADLVDDWKATADLLVADRASPPEALGLVRDHLTASDVVALSAEPEKFMLNQRRPIPQQPSRAARIGNEVHEAIALYYEAPATLDIDAVADPDEMPIDMDRSLTKPRAKELFARFEDSPYSKAPRLAIEQSLEVRILDWPVRCVIDAVLDTSAIPGAKPVTIVDWKTGKYPGAEAVSSRRLQLALYRLVWAKVHGLELDEIDALFYYLGENDPAKRELRADVMTEEEVAEHIRMKLAEGEQLNAEERAARRG